MPAPFSRTNTCDQPFLELRLGLGPAHPSHLLQLQQVVDIACPRFFSTDK